METPKYNFLHFSLLKAFTELCKSISLYNYLFDFTAKYGILNEKVCKITDSFCWNEVKSQLG